MRYGGKDREYSRLLNTTKWRRLRIGVLTRHPLCEECSRHNRITAATEVHHIRPIERGKDIREKVSLAYDPANLEALCHACHMEIHKCAGKSTKEENQARQEERARSFTEKYTRGIPPGGIFSKGGGVH